MILPFVQASVQTSDMLPYNTAEKVPGLISSAALNTLCV